MPLKRDKVIRELSKKGFKKVVSRDHIYLFLINPDNQEETVSYIRTKVSHGGKKYKTLSDDLVTKMRKNLKFENKRSFEKFVDCSYDLKEYINDLKRMGFFVNKLTGRRLQSDSQEG